MAEKNFYFIFHPIVLLILTICLFSAGLSWFLCSNKNPHFVAYSWSNSGVFYEHIIPFHWLKSNNSANLEQIARETKTATDKMPSGHRVILSWDLKSTLVHRSNKDFLMTPKGDIAGCVEKKGFKSYRSLWWDNGVAQTQKKFEDFFNFYSSVGGKLDMLVLDFEQNFSYWNLRHLLGEKSACNLDDYLNAIQNDPRFSSLKEKLGFNDLKALNQWTGTDEQLRWSALISEHVANYINLAVFKPLHTYYPDAALSNYGYFYQSSQLKLPDIYGHYSNRYSKGIHVGTHQSQALYGWMNFPAQFTLGGIKYPATPFNALRFSINKLRAMLLSSSTPISPWVAYKGFKHSQLKDNDYYQELIFHILLSGIDRLLYWNPSEEADFSLDNDLLLNQLLSQFNRLVDSDTHRFQKQAMADWQDDLLITKMQLNNKQQLWRLTMRLNKDQSISNLIEQHQPAKIRMGDAVLDFDKMQVLQTDENYSDKGLWLISY